MNKKIKKYKKKADKIKNTVIAIGVSIFLLGILISIVYFQLNKSKASKKELLISNEDGTLSYSIDLLDNTVCYEDNVDLNLNIVDWDKENRYKISINVDEDSVINENINNEKSYFRVALNGEGKKKINLIIYINEKEKSNITINVYYIKPYEKQLLDELSNKSVLVHYRNTLTNYDDGKTYEKSLNMIHKCGFKNINCGVIWNQVDNGNGIYNFDDYKKWISLAKDLGINVSLRIGDTKGDKYGRLKCNHR